MTVVDRLLRRPRRPTGRMVHVQGGWVADLPTVPLDGGVKTIVRFAERCHLKNLELNRQVMQLSREIMELRFERDHPDTKGAADATL